MSTQFVYPAVLPAVPGLNSDGLGYIRDDLLRRAAAADRQGAEAMARGNLSLMQRCGGEAHALRSAAQAIVLYALDPTWQTDTTPTVYPIAVPEAPAGVTE
jgi:hypothetical protein